MFDADAWDELLASLARHKLRTALTGFGVFWGIFMLVLLLGAGQGLRESARRGIGQSARSIAFWSSQPTTRAYQGYAKGRSVRLDDGDVALLAGPHADVDSVVASNELKNQPVRRGKRFELYALHGDAGHAMALRDHVLLRGRAIDLLDNAARRKVAVIGTRASKVLFQAGEEALGQRIEIGGLVFQVVGVFDTRAAGDLRAAEMIYLPNATLRQVFMQGDGVDRIAVLPAAGVDAAALAPRLTRMLAERHHVAPDDAAPIASFSTQQQSERQAALYGAVAALGWVVAAGALLAGVVGVANIMTVAVRERRREIGIRKALGAPPGHIVALVVAEALLVAFVAGACGLIAGVAALELAAWGIGQQAAFKAFVFAPVVDAATAGAALLLLMLAAAGAALMPARRAARIDIVQALYEG